MRQSDGTDSLRLGRQWAEDGEVMIAGAELMCIKWGNEMSPEVRGKLPRIAGGVAARGLPELVMNARAF